MKLGFTESVVAAAGSRIGKRVLHIDPNHFYGGQWASFSLEGLQTFIDNENSRSNETETRVDGGTITLNDTVFRNIEHAEYEWHAPNEPPKVPELEQPPRVEEKEPESDQTPNSSAADDGSVPQIDTTTSDTQTPAPASNEKVAIPKPVVQDQDIVWTREKLLEESRKFNIDLAPKVRIPHADKRFIPFYLGDSH